MMVVVALGILAAAFGIVWLLHYLAPYDGLADRLRGERRSALQEECAAVGWTLTEEYPGIWVVRGRGLSPASYAAHSLMGIQRFLDGFLWGQAAARREADGTPAER